MLSLTGGLYVGWAIGANNAANVFGTAVAARIITFRKACILCSLALIAGAMLQGEEGIHTLSGLTTQNPRTLLVVSLAAAFTVTLMTFVSMPVSNSQAIVGAILGVGLVTRNMYWGGLLKVIICWVATPIGGALVACILYKLVGWVVQKVPMSMFTRDKILWGGLLVVGVYGSYALGANNVANATGIFSGAIPGMTDSHLALLGGLAIAAGVMTYSRRVMLTVGSGIMRLDAFTAFVAVSSLAVTVHVFAFIGVPVSTSQAIVGAILGIGFLRGGHGIRFRPLLRIAFAWLLTPTISLILAAAGYAIFCPLGK